MDLGVGDFGEVRPDLIVEKVLTDRLVGFYSTVDLNRLLAGPDHVVGQRGEVSDVVQVRVREHDVSDLLLIVDRYKSYAASINGDNVVNHE